MTAVVEIVVGDARVHLAASYHEDRRGYWPHFMLQEYWRLDKAHVEAISVVIDQVYVDFSETQGLWSNPIVCVAAAVAVFLEHWQTYGDFVKDSKEETDS